MPYRGGRWGTTDDFTTSFLHFSLFSSALWDLAKSGPVHSLMLLFFHLWCCLPSIPTPSRNLCVLGSKDMRRRGGGTYNLSFSLLWISVSSVSRKETKTKISLTHGIDEMKIAWERWGLRDRERAFLTKTCTRLRTQKSRLGKSCYLYPPL